MAKLIIEKDNLIHNLNTYQNIIGDAKLIPVLKGNAYGLGDIETCRILMENGINFVAVSRLEEAVRLKEHFENLDILLMSPYSTAAEAELIVKLNITAAADSEQWLNTLNDAAAEQEKTAKIHIKFDTGMGRYGFMPSDAALVAQTVIKLDNIEVEGVFTHLSNCFGENNASVKAQCLTFHQIVDTLKSEGLNDIIVHIANSTGGLLYPDARLDAVRVGSALLGRLSVPDRWGFKRVGKFEENICDIRELPSGHTVGYANTYTTKKATKIAVLPCGYADGIFVEKKKDTFRFIDILRNVYHDIMLLIKGNKYYCKINGNNALLIGRIGFTSITADVTNIECKTGDKATFDCNPLFVDSSVEREYI